MLGDALVVGARWQPERQRRARSDGARRRSRGPDHSEGREVHPGRPEAGSAKCRDHAAERLRAERRRPPRRAGARHRPRLMADHLPVQYGLVEGHGHRGPGPGSGPPSRAPCDRRSPEAAEGSHRDPLARETEADGPGELVVCEQLLQNGSPSAPASATSPSRTTPGGAAPSRTSQPPYARWTTPRRRRRCPPGCPGPPIACSSVSRASLPSSIRPLGLPSPESTE